MWSWALIIISLASIAFADHMARVRGRSTRIWFWIAFIAGPLAPLVLLAIGEAKRPATVSAR